jgi:hypothetical protein
VLFDTWPHAQIWPLLLYFAAMSTNAHNISEYYHEYKVTVCNNLLAGIVCGEGQVTRRHPSFSEPLNCTYDSITGAYIVVYVAAVYYVLL